MKRVGVICLITLVCLGVFIHTKKTFAEDTTWLAGNNSASIKEMRALAPGETLPRLHGYANIPCTPQLTKVRVIKKYLGVLPVLGHEYKESCNVPTAFGFIGSFIGVDGYDGAFQKTSLNHGSIKPIPFRDTVYITSGSDLWGAAAYLYRLDNFKINTEVNEVFSPDNIRVKNFGEPIMIDGRRAVIQPSTISVSRNSQWFVAGLNGNGFILLSVDDKSAPPIKFGPSGYTYDMGFDPHVRSTVSDSGRYVAISSFSENLNIYSTSSDCGSNCQISLTNRLRELTKDEKILYINFISEDELEVHLNGTYGGDNRYTKIVHIFPNEASRNRAENTTPKYLALGDSFSSGEGAFNYREGTDMPDNRCHQSLLAFSEIVSLEANISDHHSVACSGAKIQDINYAGDESYYNNESAQSKGMKSDDLTDFIYDNFLPGYRQQNEIVERHMPNIITISVSGNDLGFSDKIQTCITRSTTCYNSKRDRIQALQEILNQMEPLKTALANVKQKADPNVKFYVLGYPRLFPSAGGDNCQLNTPFDANERLFANDLVHDINSMIKLSAKAVGASYIDMENALATHELCSGNTPAFNGLTAGNDMVKFIGYPIGKESFHPNQTGHQLMASQLLKQTNNFTKENPEPESISFGTISRLTGEAMDSPAPNDLPILVNNTSMAADSFTLQGSKNVNINLNNSQNFLLANTNYDVVVHSDPLKLGTIKSDENGNLNGSVTLPDNLTPGWHEIHIIGKTHDGKTVDYYKSIFVSASSFAKDRDCAGVELSGTDYDQDGIDDACDGNIGSPPIKNADKDMPALPVLQGAVNLTDKPRSFKDNNADIVLSSEAELPPFGSLLSNIQPVAELPATLQKDIFQNVLGDSYANKNNTSLKEEKSKPSMRWGATLLTIAVLLAILLPAFWVTIRRQTRY